MTHVDSINRGGLVKVYSYEEQSCTATVASLRGNSDTVTVVQVRACN